MKELLKIFGIEWILFFIALAIVDMSVAMLGIMFLGPVAVGIFFLIGFIMKKFEQKFFVQKMFKILRVISVLLAVSVSVFIVWYGVKQNSPAERFKSVILNPIPESVQNIERGGNLNAMGSSSFFITFDISQSDFNKIMATEKFAKFAKNDINNIGGRSPKLYEEAVTKAKKYIVNPSEVYIYEHKNSAYRFDMLIINIDHNKIYYTSK